MHPEFRTSQLMGFQISREWPFGRASLLLSGTLSIFAAMRNSDNPSRGISQAVTATETGLDCHVAAEAHMIP